MLALAKRIVAGEMQTQAPRFWRDRPEKGLKGWMKYVRLLVMGSPEQRQQLTLGQKIGFYIRRPFSLIKNHGPSLLRLLTGDRHSRDAWDAQHKLTNWLRD